MDNSEIVGGVDGSPHADAAVRWAAAHARHTGARLRLLHAYVVPVPAPAMPLAAGVTSTVAPDDYLAETGRAVLAAAADVARRHAPGVDVTTDLRVGGAAAVLVDASAAAGLVVVGSRGLGGIRSVLLGSVGVQVSAHAHCPTIVVRATAAAGGPVVVGVDGSAPARAALAFAFAEAHRLGGAVIAVHAWSPPLPTGPGEATVVALSGDGDRDRFQRAARQTLTDALTDSRRK
jgi:nucleotide-binding universal stress UspA family protein